jgi:outer membrane lipoprotein SlyB
MNLANLPPYLLAGAAVALVAKVVIPASQRLSIGFLAILSGGGAFLGHLAATSLLHGDIRTIWLANMLGAAAGLVAGQLLRSRT